MASRQFGSSCVASSFNTTSFGNFIQEQFEFCTHLLTFQFCTQLCMHITENKRGSLICFCSSYAR